MGSFDGVAEIYESSRHGYPPEFRDHLVQLGALQPSSAVVDLGAGTGQLAIMAAAIASNVLAIDPEPDMVRTGELVTADLPGIRWMLGSDRDLSDLLESHVDLVLIGNAFHHMDQARLLADLDSLVKPTGAVVVCSTSIPVWLQETDWSVALRHQLSQELGRPVGEGGVPDHETDVAVLEASAFSEVERWSFACDRIRSVESIVGEVVSSASGAIGGDSAERLALSLAPYLDERSLSENVRTTALIARRTSLSN